MPHVFDSLAHLPHLGEILSLTAALTWAVAIVIFRVAGHKVDPLAINLFKNGLGVLLLVPTMLLLGQPLLPRLPAGTYLIFALSGVLGIALSDTLLLVALNKLGAELFAIIDCGYSPFVIGMSFFFLGERMSALQLSGVGLILAAVLLVTGAKSDTSIPRRVLLSGVAIGAVSVFFLAAGIVMVKPLLTSAPLLWSSAIRMAAGTVSVGAFLAFHPRRREILRPLGTRKALQLLVPGSIFATYLSNVSWLAGMALTAASVASALNQMSTIFVFLMAAIFLKEKITPVKLAAVILAFAGAILVSVAF